MYKQTIKSVVAVSTSSQQEGIQYMLFSINNKQTFYCMCKQNYLSLFLIAKMVNVFFSPDMHILTLQPIEHYLHSSSVTSITLGVKQEYNLVRNVSSKKCNLQLQESYKDHKQGHFKYIPNQPQYCFQTQYDFSAQTKPKPFGGLNLDN